MKNDTTTVRIGTRGSQLALVQAGMVRDKLLSAHPRLKVEICPIKTTGDAILDRNLTEIGGKGLFIKEIEEHLLDGRVDIAVHSMKDLPAFLPELLEICCLLPREDPRDVLVSQQAHTIEQLPPDCTVGTSSPRRAAQILHMRPDVKVIPFRGNVQTRLQKITDGEVDATFLALAGLNRLNISNRMIHPLATEKFVPAVAQGAVGIEIHKDNRHLKELLAPFHHTQTAFCVAAERAFLAEFEGSCHTPVAALATLSGRELTLQCLMARPNGSQLLRTSRLGSPENAVSLGIDAATELRAQGGKGFFDG